MKWSGLSHRVVVRDAKGAILEDHEFPHFAAAKPVYDEMVANAAPGVSIALQHGIRVIFKAGPMD